MLIILLRILNYLILSHNIGKEKPWWEFSDVFFSPPFFFKKEEPMNIPR
jgi:hypothetical protein